MGHARFVGRVGALAVALGVGLATASGGGVAWADDAGADSTSDGAVDGTTSTATPDTGTGTTGTAGPGDTTGTTGPDTTGTATPGGSDAGLLDVPRAIVRSSGGALISRLFGGARPDGTPGDTAGDATPPRQRSALPPVSDLAPVSDVVSRLTTPVREPATRIVDDALSGVVGQVTHVVTSVPTARAADVVDRFVAVPRAAQVNTAPAPVAAAETAAEPVSEIVSTLLAAVGFAPSAAGSSGAPADSPLVAPLLLLQWVRREFERTFFNQAPSFGQDVSLTVDEGSTGNVVPLPAEDGEGDALSYSLDPANGPAHGTVTVTNGVVTYTPDAGYDGPDSFTLVASDANADFHLHFLESLFNPSGAHNGSVTVNVTVVDNNDPPVIGAATQVSFDPDTGESVYEFTVTDDATAPANLVVTVTKPAGATGTLEVEEITDEGVVVVRYTPTLEDRVAAYGVGIIALAVTADDGDAQSTATLDAQVADLPAAVLDTTAIELDFDGPYIVIDTVEDPRNGKLYATVLRFADPSGGGSSQDYTISVVDVADSTEIAEAYQFSTAGVGDMTPQAVALLDIDTVIDDEGRMYVPKLFGGPGEQGVAVVDLDTGAVEQIAVDGAVSKLALAPDGSTVYARVAKPVYVDANGDGIPDAAPTSFTISVVDLADPDTPIGQPFDVAATPGIGGIPEYLPAYASPLLVDSQGRVTTLGSADKIGDQFVTDLVVYDADGNREITQLDGFIVSIGMTPDGSRTYVSEFVTSADTGALDTFRVVDLDSGEVMYEMNATGTSAGTNPWADPVISPDGDRLVIGTSTGLIVIDTVTNSVIAEIDELSPSLGVYSEPSFTQDGSQVVFSRVLGLGQSEVVTFAVSSNPAPVISI